MKGEHEIQFSDKNRARIKEWGQDGELSLDFDAISTPGGSWSFTGGQLLSKGAAAALAIVLLNKSGNASMLVKKHRWED